MDLVLQFSKQARTDIGTGSHQPDALNIRSIGCFLSFMLTCKYPTQILLSASTHIMFVYGHKLSYVVELVLNRLYM